MEAVIYIEESEYHHGGCDVYRESMSTTTEAASTTMEAAIYIVRV